MGSCSKRIARPIGGKFVSVACAAAIAMPALISRPRERATIGLQWQGSVVQCGRTSYASGPPDSGVDRLGTAEPGSVTLTLLASLTNRRMPNGTYGGVGAGGE